MKYMFCFIGVILCTKAFATGIVASSIAGTYEAKFIDKPTGVYQESDYLFFVVKQPCLSKRKYSSTKESREAEKIFYGQLVHELNARSISFNPASIPFEGALKEDIFTEISKTYDAKKAISHQLLFDRDSKGCIREYVRVAKAEQFEKDKIIIPQEDIVKVQSELIVHALTEEDNARLSSYFTSLKLNQLALIYKEIGREAKYPFSIKFHNDLSHYETYCKDDYYCKSKLKSYSAYDFNGVLATTFNAKGVINLTSLNPNIEMAKEFYLQAKSNFDKGQNPKKIVRDLSLSINANPLYAEAWKTLSDIYRATNKNQLALWAANQYNIQHSTTAESWVYLLKALHLTNKAEASQLHSLLISIANHVELSAWAQKQIKDYK